MTQPPTNDQARVYHVQRTTPSYPVTYALLGLNVAVYLAQTVLGPQVAERLGLSVDTFLAEPWRLLTSAFIHFGILHVGMNMLALVLLGRPLEMIFGRAKFAALYLIAALGGSAVTLLLTPDNANVLYGGASGAIFGLFGALVVLQVYKLIRAGNLFLILGLNLALSFMLPGIAWQAHLGGLIIGAGIAWALVRGLRRDTSTSTMWVEIGLITALVAAAVVARYTIMG